MLKNADTQSIAPRLRDLKHAVPFAAFRVRTGAGETLTLTTPDDFIVSPTGDTGFFNSRESQEMRMLHLRDVRSIEVLGNHGRRAAHSTKPRGKK